LTDFNGRSPISAVLGVPEARAVVSEVAPELLDSSTLLPGFPLKSVMRLVLGEDDPRVETILERVSEFQDPPSGPPEEPAIAADEQYEPESVERASAAVELPAEAEKNKPLDLVLLGPSHGNPFVDVDVRAEFRCGEVTLSVGGFYDDGGRYVVRFLPPIPGTWEFSTRSTARSLDGIAGQVTVHDSHRLGPVRVVDQYHFANSDGSPFIPIGTTASLGRDGPFRRDSPSRDASHKSGSQGRDDGSRQPLHDSNPRPRRAPYEEVAEASGHGLTL
jgi:hypothetical protein